MQMHQNQGLFVVIDYIPELCPQWRPWWSLYSLQPARCSRLGQGSPLLLGRCSMWRTRARIEGWQGLAQPLQKLHSLTAQSRAGCWHRQKDYYRKSSAAANN